MKLKKWTGVALLALFAQTSWAATVAVTDAWARTTMPGQQVSGAYMKIESDADARIIGFSSPAVARVEMHEMKMVGDMMRMRELKTIRLPKGRTVTLEPGGYHLMLINPKQPIAEGDVIPLTLMLESGGKRQTIKVNAIARSREGAAHAHHH